jgi:hypothetical protein
VGDALISRTIGKDEVDVTKVVDRVDEVERIGKGRIRDRKKQ